VTPTVLYYRPYPASLEPLPLKGLEGESFASWLDMWLALILREGQVIVVLPVVERQGHRGFQIPRGNWNIPGWTQVFFCDPDHVDDAWHAATDASTSVGCGGMRAQVLVR
jgi:hypothetical protein